MRPTSALFISGVIAATAFTSACGPRAPARTSANESLLPDVRTASGRPPVVLVVREGDPATAIAIAVTTTGVPWGDAPGDDPEAATALAALVEARLKAKGVDASVTPSWDGVRVSSLATSSAEAARVAAALREALMAPANESDLGPVRRKLTALGQRPLQDRALGRWARCVGSPYALAERSGKNYADVDVAKLERWRSASLGLGRVAVAVAGPRGVADSVAATILKGPAWTDGAPIPRREKREAAVDVFETTGDLPVLHVTLDVGSSSSAVTTAEALGDPRGPLAARLSELDLPFRLREVTGTAHAHGGCVGVVLEALSPAAPSVGGPELATRAADAATLVHLEAAVFLAEVGVARDGRSLSRRSGNAREAAERAAWWALVDKAPPRPTEGGSITLGVPSRRSAGDGAMPSRELLETALRRAGAAWDKPVIEARTRVESGQGEIWVLVGSPCGVKAETDADAGLTATFVAAAAEGVRTSADVRVEPWVAADGAGLLVHGPALAGESPVAHARRIADIAARGFAAEPLSSSALGQARANLLKRDTRSDGAALGALASMLSPQHPSRVVPWGSSESLARSSDGAVRLRAQALRSGPLRVAVLANVDSSQADAAVRAADRWVARRATGQVSCEAPSEPKGPKPGTYTSTPLPGSIPVAYLAFPFSPGDDKAQRAARILASALAEGDDALLGGSARRAHETSARVLGWPLAPALVVRIAAPEASLDEAVMQARSILDRIRNGGLSEKEFARATALRAREELVTALDPRARIVATWRKSPTTSPEPKKSTVEDVRSFAREHLDEATMIVVASRPARPTSP